MFQSYVIHRQKSDDNTPMNPPSDNESLRPENALKFKITKAAVQTQLMYCYDLTEGRRETKIQWCEISWVPSSTFRTEELTKIVYYTLSKFQKSV